MIDRLKYKLLLFIIIIIAATLRLYNINWDNGSHIHPDERAIIMSVTELEFPNTIAEFLSSNSTWNPHFFAYGSLPFYLLRVIGNLLGIINPLLGMYDQINLIGRVISAVFDLGTVITLYFLGRRLKNKYIGIIAAFLYATSVLPVQLSHFYAVDTILTFFITLTLFLLIDFYEKPKILKSVIIGIVFGLSLATKISATVLLTAFIATIGIDFWGQGLLPGILSICGVIFVSISVFRKNINNKNTALIILLVFFWSYFFVVGRFAIGFMRYMLPLYPLFCLFAAIFLTAVYKTLATKLNKHILNTCYIILATSILIWPLSFMQIYNKAPTRQVAT